MNQISTNSLPTVDIVGPQGPMVVDATSLDTWLSKEGYSLPADADVEVVKETVAAATEEAAAAEETVTAELDNSFGSTDAQEDKVSEEALEAKRIADEAAAAEETGAAGSGVAGVIGGNGEDTASDVVVDSGSGD